MSHDANNTMDGTHSYSVNKIVITETRRKKEYNGVRLTNVLEDDEKEREKENI